jgi:acetylornithine deacetylase/succinyl-diaminopimelate desuccinylase-like protein
VPLPDNAIYRLARALDRLAQHRFPVRLNPTTRAYLAARAAREPADVARAMRGVASAPGEPPAAALSVIEKNPVVAALLRTTCVATLVAGGSRANALPAEATATLNCRILPGEPVADVERVLADVLHDPEIEVRATSEFGWGDPSPLDGPGPAAIRAVAQAMWPGAPIVPFMSRGASDSRFLRAAGIAAYGLSPIALSEADGRREHGVDERIPAGALRPAVECLHRLVVALAARRPD